MPRQPDEPRRHAALEVDEGHARVALVHREARDQRDAHPGRDHLLDRRVVVGAEGERGLDAGRAHAGLDLPRPDARPVSDERQTPDLAEAGRRPPAGERRSGLGHEHVRVTQELGRLDRRRCDRQDQERQIEVAGLERRDEHVVLGLGQAHLDARPRLGEPAQELRQEARAGALEGPHPQRARLAGGKRRQIGPRRAEPRDDRVGMGQEHAPGLGQLRGPRAAGPVDQALADEPLEGRELLAHGRLGVAERLCGAAERAVLGDGLECRQMAQLDAQPVIRFHNQSNSS